MPIIKQDDWNEWVKKNQDTYGGANDKIKTVKVKIAVAIDETGKWYATGWRGQSDSDVKETVVDEFETEGNYMVHFVEADVPIPETETIQGRIVEQ